MDQRIHTMMTTGGQNEEWRQQKKQLSLVFRIRCIDAHVTAIGKPQKAHTHTHTHAQVQVLILVMVCSHQNVMNGSSLAVYARAFVCLMTTSAAH